MQQQMMETMKGEDGDEIAQMSKAVDTIEAMLDSGAFQVRDRVPPMRLCDASDIVICLCEILQPEDLAHLKDLIASSFGMSIEEVLARKEELQAGYPEEGKKLFDILERLFGDPSKTKTRASDSAVQQQRPRYLTQCSHLHCQCRSPSFTSV